MKDLQYYAEKSLTGRNTNSLECNLDLDVDGEKFRAYEVNIAYLDLMFLTDKGVLTYVVDDYGNGNLKVELFNVERD